MLDKNSNQLDPVFECIATVIENRIINQEYRHLILTAPQEALDIKPGQFFHIQCPPMEGAISYLRRPMSVYHFDKGAGQIEFLYKIHGKGTSAMSTLGNNNEVNILGPLGKGFWLEENWQSLMLIARGVGLATLAPLARYASERGRKLTAICSARSPDADGSSSVGNLELIINTFVVEQGVDAFFTCGSNRILKLLQQICKREDIPGQIALEQQMACGLGMCFCCVRPFNVEGKIIHRRVCNEGPVFNLMESQPW
jgi:dihydroorotate dehydrogenase electron transfer subunit